MIDIVQVNPVIELSRYILRCVAFALRKEESGK